MPHAARLVNFLRSHTDAAVFYQGDLDFDVARLCHVEDATCDSMSWLRWPPDGPVHAGVLVAQIGDEARVPRTDVQVFTRNPIGLFAKIIVRFFGVRKPDGRQCMTAGSGCRLHRSVELGWPGQTYLRQDGKWRAFPHRGELRLGDDVEVGPYTSIMRGSIGDTVIGSGCRIGNQVNIGHDARLGENVLVVAGARIAGWARIEDDVRIDQGALVKNGVRVGKGARIGMGAVVLQDVPPGEVWAGNPAKKL